MRNLMITMFLGGLWHGAGFFFILWGVYHGLLLIIYRLVPVDEYLKRWFGQRLGKIVAIAVFFHLVCFGWIFFRATPEQFGPIWRSIIAVPGSVVSHVASYTPYFSKVSLFSWDFMRVCHGMLQGWLSTNWTFLVYGWGILLFASPAIVTDIIAWRKGVEFPDLYERMALWLKVAIILLLVYAIQFFGRRESNEFIYFAF